MKCRSPDVGFHNMAELRTTMMVFLLEFGVGKVAMTYETLCESPREGVEVQEG